MRLGSCYPHGIKPLGRSGTEVSAIGMGTWGIGGFENRGDSVDSLGIVALRRGLDLGMNLIDTAEMYGQGHSEVVVAEAISGRSEGPSYWTITMMLMNIYSSGAERLPLPQYEGHVLLFIIPEDCHPDRLAWKRVGL